MGVLQFT